MRAISKAVRPRPRDRENHSKIPCMGDALYYLRRRRNSVASEFTFRRLILILRRRLSFAAAGGSARFSQAGGRAGATQPGVDYSLFARGRNCGNCETPTRKPWSPLISAPKANSPSLTLQSLSPPLFKSTSNFRLVRRIHG